MAPKPKPSAAPIAAEIREMMALARRQQPAAVPLDLAAGYIAAGLTVEAAREALFDLLAEATDAAPVASFHCAGASGGSPSPVPEPKPTKPKKRKPK